MKNLVKKTIVLTMLGSFILSHSSNLLITAFASEQLPPIPTVEFKNNNQSAQPRWWPGNPSAPVGSEEWIHQNWNYSGGDAAKQTECAKNVIIPTVSVATAENISLWAWGGTLTVGSVFLSAGVSYVVTYYGCMIS